MSWIRLVLAAALLTAFPATGVAAPQGKDTPHDSDPDQGDGG